MRRIFAVFALILAVVAEASPAGAAEQVLPPAQVDEGGRVKFRGGPRLGRNVGGVYHPAPALPRVSAVVEGAVVADGVTDQAANIMTAAAAVPTSGGILVLPCGRIVVASTLTLSNQNLIVEGGGQYCTTIVAAATFTAGDVLRLTGNYSTLRDVGFQQQATSAQISAGITPFRTSGYTVNLAGAYQSARNVSFQHCYVCIRLGATAGWSHVSDADMTLLTPASRAPGSGGILVDNPTYGPNNRIDNLLAYSSSGAPVDFGIKIINSGGTAIDTFDVLGFTQNLVVAPGDAAGYNTGVGNPGAQTSQALQVSNGYFDSAQGAQNVVFRPTGSGYIFSSTFNGVWLTNTGPGTTDGLSIDTSASTRTDQAAFKGFTFATGFVVATGNGNNGFVCQYGGATSKPSDITITGTLFAGWNVGVNLGCADGTVLGNHIGAYSPFSTVASVYYAIFLNAGQADGWLIHGNRIKGAGAGSAGAITDNSGGGSNRITDNLGFNGQLPATSVAVGASPFTITNGPVPATYYVNGGAVTSIVAPGGNVALASQSPAAISLGPNEKAIVTYAAAPTIARMPH